MRVIHFITFFMLIVLIASCSTEESDVKDMKDIAPSADGEYDSDTSNVNGSSDSLEILKAKFSELGIEFDSINRVTTRLMADRFGHKSDEKYELIGSGQVLHIYSWIYKDSARVTNSLFNWIDCFGKDCRSIQVGESKNLQKDAFHLYANDETMIFIESDHAIKTRSLEAYLESEGYEKDWNFVLEQSRSGRVRWYKYEDDKKTTVKFKD